MKAAADLIGKMDETVDPCQDFYKFSCGGFIKNVNVPVGASMFSTLGAQIDVQVCQTLDRQFLFLSS